MGIEHTALYVRDLEAAKRFFTRYFHAQPGADYHNPRTGFRSCFLSFDSGGRLELMWLPELAEGDRAVPAAGFAHVAFSVGSRQAVDALTDRLRQDGYPVLSGPRFTGDGYYESCVSDGECNRIEITV